MTGATPLEHVLIVDDDRDIRESVAEVLRDAGYSVGEAANGTEALAYLRSGAGASVILLDILMPEMDGAQFRLEQLRDSSIAHIPIVVLTAHEKTHRALFAMSAAAVLRKPIGLDDLLTALRPICAPRGGVLP